MELVRFPSQAHINQTAEYLSGKYAEAPPDILIALGRAAIPFLAKNHNVLAPNVPTIIANVPAREVTVRGRLDNFFFVATEYSFSRTLELALRLQPKARNVAVIGGASDYDRQWLDDARRELQPYSDRYAIKYITGLPYDEMLNQVSKLSKDTIAIMSFVFVDGSGQHRVPPEVAASVAAISPAPVYSPISSYLGVGIVGGYMDSWEEQGVAAADRRIGNFVGQGSCYGSSSNGSNSDVSGRRTTAQAMEIEQVAAAIGHRHPISPVRFVGAIPLGR